MFSLVFVAAVLTLSQAEVIKISTVNPSDLEPASARIVGGNPAAIELYPYTVQVLGGHQFRCGGTLLTRRHVLSSAQCFVTSQDTVMEAEFFSIRAGSSFIHPDSDGQTVVVSKIVVHENYNSTNFDSDLAVLLLNTSVILNVRVQPAVLPSPGFNLPYQSLLVAVGWGQTMDVGVSEVLKDILLQKVNTTECAEAYERRAINTSEPYEVTSNMICAGWSGFEGFGTCFGDNGGPLVSTYNQTQVVIGVTSWGPTGECGHPDYMGVSVRVANFIDWINNTVSVELAVEPEPEDGGNGEGNSATSNLTNSVVLVASFLMASLVIFKDVR